MNYGYTLSQLIKEVNNNSIVLPSFQREFSWDEDRVKKLIGSYLFGVKIGALILFKYTNKDTSSRMSYSYLYSNEIFKSNEDQNISYLIDGQQRVTSTLLAFTNYFDKSSRKERKLKQNYYIEIDLDKVYKGDAEDLFGLKELDFKFPELEYYDEFIDTYLKVSKSNNDLHCTDNLVRIPLKLIHNLSSEDDMRESLQRTLSMSMKSVSSTLSFYFHKLNDYNVDESKEDALEEYIRRFQNYIDNVLRFQIPIIQIEDVFEQALKTYEILNTAGKPIKNIDIIAARYATTEENDDSEKLYTRIYDTLLENITPPKDLDKYNLVGHTQSNFADEENKFEWNFFRYLISLESKPDKISSKFEDQFLKLLKFIELADKDEDLKYRIDSYKAKEILAMPSNLIYSNTDSSLEALKWAGMFLQFRCGVTRLDNVKYYWKLFLIAAYYHSNKTGKYEIAKDDIDLLEAWYFLARFSGRYTQYQNSNAMKDLKLLLGDKKELKVYLKQSELSKFNDVNGIDFPDFVKLDRLLRKKDESGLMIEQNYIVQNFISEFGIRKGYFTNIIKAGKEVENHEHLFRVTTLLYPYKGIIDYRLDYHHIYPLSTSQSLVSEVEQGIRKNKDHEFNSPLNFVYLTNKENIKIGAKHPKDYIHALHNTFIKENSIAIIDELNVTQGTSSNTNQSFLTNSLRARHKMFFENFYSEVSDLLV